jgi:hypothetical protein
MVVAGWLMMESATLVRRGRGAGPSSPLGEQGRIGRRLTSVVAAVGAFAALVTVTVIRAIPGLVDVGFLGWIAFPLPVRLAFHLPLAVAVLAAGLAARLVAGAFRHWWIRWIRPSDTALAIALIALTAQLASWHLVAWGL